MSRYMTNINLSEKENIEKAAKESGFNVEFRDHPMPLDDWYDFDEDMRSYDPDEHVGVYGSVYTNEPWRDHSPFLERIRPH